MESLPDETDKVFNDFPSFSLGIEFEISGGEKDVEVPVRKSDSAVEKSDKVVEKSDKTVEKSDKTVEKGDKEIENSDKRIEESDKALEMNLNDEIEFHEDDWLRVADIVARSLAKNRVLVFSFYYVFSS